MTKQDESGCGCAPHSHEEGCGCGSHDHEHGAEGANGGTFIVERAACGPLGLPEWVGMQVSGGDSGAMLVLPTLQSVAIASSYLAVAQSEGMRLPPETVQAALESQLETPTAAPIIAAGLNVSEDGEELHINVGFGVMRFVLTGAAREKAKQIAGKQG